MWILALTALALTPASVAQTWEDFTPSVAQDRLFIDLDIDPTDPGHMVAVQSFSPLLETLDGGASWRIVTLPSPPGQPTGNPELPWSCAFDAEGRLYVGVIFSGAPTNGRQMVYKRQSGTFELFGPNLPVASGLSTIFSATVAAGQADANLVAVGINHSDEMSFSGSTLWGSIDAGSSWTSWPVGNGSIYSLMTEQSPMGSGVIVASLDPLVQTGPEPVVLRIDASTGASTTLASGIETTLNVRSGRVRPDTLVLVDSSFNQLPPPPIQKSLDGGLTWTPLPGSELYVSVDRGEVNEDLLVRSWRPSANLTSVELSSDGGSTWSQLGGAKLTGGLSRVSIGRADRVVYAVGTKRLFRIDITREVGAVECSTAPNSTGVPAQIALAGSQSVSEDDLRVWVSSVPPETVGIMLVSTTADLLPAMGNRFGPICVGGSIGRGSFTFLGSGPHGEFFFDAQLGALPGPNGSVSAVAGDTWRFQGWFRDTLALPGSHTSDAIAVTMLP